MTSNTNKLEFVPDVGDFICPGNCPECNSPRYANIRTCRSCLEEWKRARIVCEYYWKHHGDARPELSDFDED